MDKSKIMADLGANYKASDSEVLDEIITEVQTIASNISHTEASENEALIPYMTQAVKAMYLARGAEGLNSRSEGSISNGFQDIVQKLRNDIVTNGLRRIY